MNDVFQTITGSSAALGWAKLQQMNETPAQSVAA
jgi:hypothetical protein